MPVSAWRQFFKCGYSRTAAYQVDHAYGPSSTSAQLYHDAVQRLVHAERAERTA